MLPQSPLTPSEIVLIHGKSFASLKRPVATALILLVVILFFLVLIFRSSTAAVDAWASRSWSHVEGRIIGSQVTAQPDYKPTIKYVYEVENRSYTGDTVWFGMSDKSFDAVSAAAVAARYPVGRSVTVTYNPQHPEKAVLEAGLRFDAYVVILFELFFMLAAIFWLATQMPLLFQRESGR